MKCAPALLASLLVGTAVHAGSGATAVELRAPDRTRFTEPRKAIPSISLTDANGRPFALDQLKGRTALVFFGFTNCPNVCPAAMQRLRQVERAVAAPDELVSVLISVDGERDTPQVMKSYLEPFGPGFVGLTGAPASVRDLGAAFSAVFFPGMPTDHNGGYNVEHTSQIYLLDSQGQLTATFYQAPVDDMVTVTQAVMREADPDSGD